MSEQQRLQPFVVRPCEPSTASSSSGEFDTTTHDHSAALHTILIQPNKGIKEIEVSTT